MKKLIGIYMVLLGLQAHAEVMIEPFVGYDQATLAAKDLSSADVGATSAGLDYGARLGYRLDPSYWVAVEYAAGSGTSKSNVAGTPDSTYTKSAMGAVVGYDQGKFRFWGGYGLSDTLTVKSSGGGEGRFMGTNYKLGLGYRPAGSLSVNLEYVVPQYSKFNAGGADADISTAYSKFDASAVNLSLSFPFDLGK